MPPHLGLSTTTPSRTVMAHQMGETNTTEIARGLTSWTVTGDARCLRLMPKYAAISFTSDGICKSKACGFRLGDTTQR